jgi:hypothetical protein
MSSPRKYRKKPVVIDAMQITDDISIASIFGWMSANGVECRVVGEKRPFGLEIETLEGVMRADHLDWIIKGVKGEFYPCKPDIFEATYEPEREVTVG